MPDLSPIDRPRLLVSVRDADEAALARDAGADLVDAKDPEYGPLGGLPVATVCAIVARVGATVLTSAVVGEAPSGHALHERIAATAAAGVDYVKVAVRPVEARATLARAAVSAPGRLIGVVFAEDGVPADLAARLAAACFRGAMIDTRGKAGLRLTDLIATAELSAFVAACRNHGLLCGLAGSLAITDIAALAANRPDYLGFRGSLCRDGDRRSALDLERVAAAVRALRSSSRRDAA